jgi:catechol 2,3-dioxygenase-like lactoylglutathione lyase family enzyme
MDASLAEQIFGPLAKPLHLGISVSNLETSVEWYSEYLGFTLTKQVDLSDNLRIAILEYGVDPTVVSPAAISRPVRS